MKIFKVYQESWDSVRDKSIRQDEWKRDADGWFGLSRARQGCRVSFNLFAACWLNVRDEVLAWRWSTQGLHSLLSCHFQRQPQHAGTADTQTFGATWVWHAPRPTMLCFFPALQTSCRQCRQAAHLVVPCISRKAEQPALLQAGKRPWPGWL